MRNPDPGDPTAPIPMDDPAATIPILSLHPTPLPGALDALRWCRRQRFRVVIYTWNTPDVAAKRIRDAGIARLIDEVLAVPQKTPEMWDLVFGPILHEGQVAVVGDSWVHDVIPALGRADAVVWVRGHRRLGLWGTPADPSAYPVAVVDSVAGVPGVLPSVLAAPLRGAERAAWAARRRRLFAAASRAARSVDMSNVVMYNGGGGGMQRSAPRPNSARSSRGRRSFSKEALL